MKYTFDSDYINNLFASCSHYIDYLDTENHILIDARNFPKVNIDVVHPKKICGEIPTEYFKDYMVAMTKYEMLIVFIHKDLVIIAPLKDFETEQSKIFSTVGKYISVYKDGIVKELYRRCRETQLPQVLAIIDGEVSIISAEDVKILIDMHKELGTFEDWKYNCVDCNFENFPSFIYIDQKDNDYWYGSLGTFEDPMRFISDPHE